MHRFCRQESTMAAEYSAASFTKNFSWHLSYERLYNAIVQGFSAGLEPVTREQWRDRSGIVDPNRQLIPMNFFLYSRTGIKADFILVDRLVEVAANHEYD